MKRSQSIYHPAGLTIEYMVVSDRLEILKGRTIGEVLSFLNKDRGWRVKAVTPRIDGSFEYLMERYMPINQGAT